MLAVGIVVLAILLLALGGYRYRARLIPAYRAARLAFRAPQGDVRFVFMAGGDVFAQFGDTDEDRKDAKQLLASLKGPGIRFLDRGFDRTPPELR